MVNQRYAVLRIGIAGLVFLITAIYVFSTPIHGDGQYHELIARQVASQGWPIKENTDFVMSFSADGAPVYAPINYPETAYFFYGLLTRIGSVALQLSSPFFAALTALAAFSILSRLNLRMAFLGAMAASLLNLRRFALTPSLEQPLLAVSLGALAFFLLWLETKKLRWAFLTAISTGLAMSIKQQGILLAPLLFVLILLCLFIPGLIRARVRFFLTASAILAVALLITLPFQIEHLKRNGTIGYVPGAGTSGILDKIPLIEKLIDNKYPADQAAADVLRGRIGYRTPNQSLVHTTAAFFAFPFTYDTSDDVFGAYRWLFVLGLFICLAGLIRILREQRLTGVILFASLCINILFAQVTHSSLWQYHVLGIALIGILFGSGLITISDWLRNRGRILRPFILCSVTVISLISFERNLHTLTFKNAGRQKPESVKAYQSLGAYIQDQLPADAIIISAGTNIVKYGGRSRFWISEGGGALLPEAYDSSSPEYSYQLFRHYPVEYLLIDEEQTLTNGLYDSILPTGLNQTIDTPEGQRFFSLLYSVARPSGTSVRLYSILKEPKNPSTDPTQQ